MSPDPAAPTSQDAPRRAPDERSETGLERLFVVGARRSGTTWTMMLFAHHPAVVALQQTDFFRRLAHLGTWFESRPAYGMCALTAAEDEARLERRPLAEIVSRERFHELVRPLARDVFESAAALASEAKAVVEQTPESIQVWETILAVFPDARFLHVVRDPRSVFASHKNAARSWADPTRFSGDPIDVAEEWNDAVARARAIAGSPAGADGRFRELRYEDLRADPEAHLTELYAWLGLEANEELVRDAVAACSLERVQRSDSASLAPGGFFRKGETEGWRRELSASETRVVEHLCATEMVRLGYEPSGRTEPVPARVRRRRRAQRMRASLGSWAWESRGPVRRGLARALKAMPGVRKLLLQRVRKPG